MRLCPTCVEESEKESKRPIPTIGVELEFIYRTIAPLIPHGYGCLKSDGSVSPIRHQAGIGAEYASAPFEDCSFNSSIAAVLPRFLDCYVNATCGYHIHFGEQVVPYDNRDNLLQWWRILEPMFLGAITTARRKQSTEGIRRRRGAPANFYHAPVRWLSFHDWRYDRYRTLNIRALDTHGTYEVRMHPGTLNPTLIIGWKEVLLPFFTTLHYHAAPKRSIKSQPGLFNLYCDLAELSPEARSHLSLRLSSYNRGKAPFFVHKPPRPTDIRA